MQRYFVAPASLGDDSVALEGEDARHLAKVMRAKPGDRFVVCDGESREALAVVRALTDRRVEADIVELRPIISEPRWAVTVAQSLPKGDKMETVIQKGTEIGAAGFVPFESERMVVQYDGKKETKRLERWRKIAREAAEQAHRGRLPAVEPVRGWRELLQSFASFDTVLFCYEKEGGAEGSGLRDAVRRAASRAGAKRPLRLLLVVGPEGGFSEREAEEASAAGAVPVGLGRRILRTETAALVALSCLMYESGEMGGA